MEQTKFEMGPIQKSWTQSMKDHPERQTTGTLGRTFGDGTYEACCLGEALLCVHRFKKTEPLWRNGLLLDDSTDISNSDKYIVHSYEKIGLRNGAGSLKNPWNTGKEIYESLASANDAEMSWPAIAAYIEANPENVFTKSV